MRIPLNDRPTLGLRGPPTRVLELERVRCRRRRRRCRSPCYEVEDAAPPPPQPNFIMANPIPNPCAPPIQTPANSRAALVTLLANLTPAAIDSLPKQTVHLPAIHLPGSQANADTELHTVVFPAELINPLDGTLSVLQATPTMNVIGGPAAMSVSMPVPVAAAPAPVVNVPHGGSPLHNYVASASGPFLQQLHDLVQRVTLSQAQAAPIPPMPPPISRIAPASVRPAPPPTTYANNAPYQPANITPYRLPANSSVRPAGVTPYRMNNATNFQPSRAPLMGTSDIGPYHPANITTINTPLNRSLPSSAAPAGAPRGMTPYILPPSQGTSGPFSPYLNSPDDASMSASTPPQSQAPYASNNAAAPRSILRNGASNAHMSTTYTRLNPTSVSSTRETVRKRTTFA